MSLESDIPPQIPFVMEVVSDNSQPDQAMSAEVRLSPLKFEKQNPKHFAKTRTELPMEKPGPYITDNNKILELRLVCYRGAITRHVSNTIKALEGVEYRCTKRSKIRRSKKDKNKRRVYLEFTL